MDLKQYNQRLLAIIGTMALVGLAFLLLAGGTIFIIDIWPRSNRSPVNNGVVIDQNQVVDTTAFSFSQEISLLEPYQLDSIQPVFIIPIGQKDQKSKRPRLALAGFSYDSDSYVEEYYYSQFYGLYNNFVLLDYLRDIKKPIFNKKVAITEWAYMKVDSARLIIFKGTDTDLNKDGLLNDEDFQSLFVLNVGTMDLRELSFKGQTVQEFEPLKKTSKIYVRTGRDLNKDLEFDSSNEPTDLYFYDVATGESETLVPDEIKKQIQEILN